LKANLYFVCACTVAHPNTNLMCAEVVNPTLDLEL